MLDSLCKVGFWFTVFVVLGLQAPATAGLEEENRPGPDPAPAGCLGSNDPYCNGGDGGTGGAGSGNCYQCILIDTGPDGTPAYHACGVANWGVPGLRYAQCSPLANGCRTQTVCQLV